MTLRIVVYGKGQRGFGTRKGKASYRDRQVKGIDYLYFVGQAIGY
jgi:hypothetical protein